MTTVMPATRRADYAAAMVAATRQALDQDERVFLYGEGINDPGAFLGTVNGIATEFGTERCFDVPNSEESLVGLGIGAALSGLRPVFVNLRLDFLMLAMSQLVNHGARWPAMTGYSATVPLTLRAIVGRSWGQAAQHAGAVYSMLANVPGVDVILPSDAAEGAGLFLGALDSPNLSVIIEEREIFGVETAVPVNLSPLPLGVARLARQGEDLTIVAISSAVGLATRAADTLAGRGISCDVIDARTARPFDAATVRDSAARTKRVAVMDVGWESFGLAAEVSRHLLTAGISLDAPLLSVARRDEHTPASCFLEETYYPRLDDVVHRIETETLGR